MTSSELSSVTPRATPTQRSRIVLLFGLALTAGIGLAWVFELSGQRSYPGSLEARTTVVTSNRPARVQDVSVKAGQSVVPGDPLFRLIDTPLEDRLIGKRREIAELEAEITRIKASVEVDLAWRRRELQSEIFETQLKEAALSQEKLNKQVEQLAWKDHLTNIDSNIGPMLAEVDHPFRSISLDLHQPDDRRLQAMLREDAAAASAETLATQVALCEQRLRKLESLENELEIKIRASSGVDVAEARLNGAKQELAALNGQFKELTMTSPTYGTVGDVKLQPGDRVPNGGTLIEILDETQPRVVAQIPSGTASKMRQGAKVTLIFPTNQQRIGIVASIPLQTTTIAGSSESFVAVKIEPAGKLWPKSAIGSGVKVLLP